MDLQKIIGLPVLSIRSHKNEKEAAFILFADFKTYIELREQDPYSFHDCSISARSIEVYQNPRMWKIILENIDSYPEATEDP